MIITIVYNKGHVYSARQYLYVKSGFIERYCLIHKPF